MLLVTYLPSLNFIEQTNTHIHFKKNTCSLDIELDNSHQKYDFSELVQPTNVKNIPETVLKLLIGNSLVLFYKEQKLDQFDFEQTPVVKYLRDISANEINFHKVLSKFSDVKVNFLNLTLYPWSPEYIFNSSFEESNLVVVIVEDYFNTALTDLNMRFRNENKNWLIVVKQQAGIHIGPYFDQNFPGCFCCFISRVETNLQKFCCENLAIVRRSSGVQLSLTDLIEFKLLETHLIKIISTSDDLKLSQIVEFNATKEYLEYHNFSVFPVCGICNQIR